MDVRAFLKANGLKQRELARFLDVTEAAISNVVKGKACFSDENLIKILNNQLGWDTSMLRDSDQPENPAEAPGTERASLSSAEMLLRDMLTEKEGKIDALNQVIWELKEENGKLKALLSERKRGTAANADFSSAADAV